MRVGLLEAILANADTSSERIAIHAPGESRPTWTYEDLIASGCSVAASLDGAGVSERVLIACDSPLNFARATLGVMIGGRIPVPVYRPRSFQDHRTPGRFDSIVRAIESNHLIADESFVESDPGAYVSSGGTALSLVLVDASAGDLRAHPFCLTQDIAFIQFTSGTTALAKGAVVRSEAAMANVSSISKAFEMIEGSVSVTWLPLFHDMGLVGGLLAPLATGGTAVLLPTSEFIRSPGSWLRAISEFEGEIGAAPDFAYERCVQRVDPDTHLDVALDSWRVAVNGSEPVRNSTIDRFSEKFARLGFKRGSFRPSYGMAEATLLLTAADGPPEARQPAEATVPCGSPVDGVEIEIRHVNGSPSEMPVGEVWVRSDGMASSYISDSPLAPDVSEPRGPDSWFRTGDLGYFENGQLHITGRIDSLLVVRGRNIQAELIESVVCEAAPPMSVCRLSGDDADGLVLTYETDSPKPEEVRTRIAGVVAAATGISSVQVNEVTPGSMPRTSSGKVIRPRVTTGGNHADI